MIDVKKIIEQHPFLTERNGKLLLEGIDLTQAAREFGTPLFVVSEAYLRKNIREYKKHFEAAWPEGKVNVLPSVKANPNIAIRRILDEEGAGCDVFGPGELECAIRAGVKGCDITLNGSIKDRYVIKKALSIGARIILDSPNDLMLCSSIASELDITANVMFRLKPFLNDVEDDSDFAPDAKIKDLTQYIKYGIPTSEAMQMAEEVKNHTNIKVVGLHIHMGRHSKKLHVWQKLVKSYINLATKLREIWGEWQPQYINFGGGFAASLDKETRVVVTEYDTPTVEHYAITLTSALREELTNNGFTTRGVVIEVEPGRAIHNQTGLHLTTVKNVKHETLNIEHKWAEVDTSEVFLGIPGFNPTPPFDYIFANQANAELNQTMDIVGLTCNAEWLYTGVPTPNVKSGDVLAMLNTGSYIEPMAANFNALPRPGILLVSGDQAEMIKRHETVEDVFFRDNVPKRLQKKIGE